LHLDAQLQALVLRETTVFTAVARENGLEVTPDPQRWVIDRNGQRVEGVTDLLARARARTLVGETEHALTMRAGLIIVLALLVYIIVLPWRRQPDREPVLTSQQQTRRGE
jgi:hypothetical protein